MKTDPAAPLNIRALARRLRLSPTTVSEALRGVVRVAPATAERVRMEAERAGYRYNRLAGAVMSQVRRAGVYGFRGVLGLIDLVEVDRPSGAAAFHAAMENGAARRSAELGFSLDRFALGPRGLAAARLNAVLAARNVGGVLVLPAFRELDLEAVDWSRLAAVYLDRVIEHPPLHCVSVDHHAAIWLALEELAARGYRRPGLVLQRRQDERLRHRLEGSFRMSCDHDPRLDPAPVLLAERVDERTFVAWLRRYRPDVVLAHGGDVFDLLCRAEVALPRSVGFVSLNQAMLGRRTAAALDLRPELLGSLGVDLLVGQILRGERGIPPVPSHTSYPACWVDGPTVRTRPAVTPTSL